MRRPRYVEFLIMAMSLGCTLAQSQPNRLTHVSIRGEDFYINGQPTYAGRTWNGHRIEGLLLNARLVQGIFDDQNPENLKEWGASRQTLPTQFDSHSIPVGALSLQFGLAIYGNGSLPWGARSSRTCTE